MHILDRRALESSLLGAVSAFAGKEQRGSLVGPSDRGATPPADAKASPAGSSSARVGLGPALLTALFSIGCTSFEFAPRHVTASAEYTGGLVIPDGDLTGIDDTLSIDEGCFILTVEVEVNIRHDFAADLSIDLKGPSDTLVRLVASEDYDDDVQDIVEVFPGTFDPVDDLIDFDGQQGLGEWTLTVRDDDLKDEGTLQSWLLRLGCES